MIQAIVLSICFYTLYKLFGMLKLLNHVVKANDMLHNINSEITNVLIQQYFLNKSGIPEKQLIKITLMCEELDNHVKKYLPKDQSKKFTDSTELVRIKLSQH